MKGRYGIAVVAASFFLMAGGFFFFLGSLVSGISDKPRKGNIAVVEVLGGIFDAKPIIEQFRKLKKDQGVKAVVLRVDSPGGSVGASQEIHEAVKDLKAAKPVVASMGTAAASGGYYIAAPATKIVANEGTMTGSIGVRMELLNVEELLRWAKLGATTIKSGRLKDVGSPTRPMTPEEREYLEGIVRGLHEQFKRSVAENRGMNAEEIEKVSDGRIFTGLEAKQNKLVDEMGGLNKAIQMAADLAGIKGEPEVFFPKKNDRGFIGALLEESIDRIGDKIISRLIVPAELFY